MATPDNHGSSSVGLPDVSYIYYNQKDYSAAETSTEGGVADTALDALLTPDSSEPRLMNTTQMLKELIFSSTIFSYCLFFQCKNSLTEEDYCQGYFKFGGVGWGKNKIFVCSLTLNA
jgi:hypothetical protein